MQIFKSLSDEQLVNLMTTSAVGILPTDTIYGIVARANDKTAVARLYTFKQRKHKPGTIIAASIEQLVELGIKRRYLTAVAQYWPGAVSVIIPCGSELNYLDLEKLSLAVRLPKHTELERLLKQTGPLVTTSANLPDEPIATTVNQAQTFFGDSVDFYVDGGDLSDHQPSTIIRIVDDAVEVIRAGAVTIDEAGRIQ